jgi:hypothetical protein
MAMVKPAVMLGQEEQGVCLKKQQGRQVLPLQGTQVSQQSRRPGPIPKMDQLLLLPLLKQRRAALVPVW